MEIGKLLVKVCMRVTYRSEGFASSCYVASEQMQTGMRKQKCKEARSAYQDGKYIDYNTVL
jgi:hypothetical protein